MHHQKPESESFVAFKKAELYEALWHSIDREILGGRGITLEEQWENFRRGVYGAICLHDLVLSVWVNHWSGEQLKGGKLPDELIDDLASYLKDKGQERQSGADPAGVAHGKAHRSEDPGQ